METRNAHLLVDLGCGDAGKGKMTDYLGRKHHAHTVVRFSGGGQAGHRVVAPDGREHVFAQFGSGTFVPGVRTFLSRFMIISPLAMMSEAATLRRKGIGNVFRRTFISENALVVSPFQRAANRLRELARGDARHGSVGMGIGETVKDSIDHTAMVLRAGDLLNIPETGRKLRLILEKKRAELADVIKTVSGREEAQRDIGYFEDRRVVGTILELFAEFAKGSQIVSDDVLKGFLATGNVVFEGAQGVLLDEWRGFHPYTTYSTCTFQNAQTLLDECGYDGVRHRIGIVRAYAVRHGPGPFVTEDARLTAALPDAENVMNDWQRAFRVGHFDAVATRYAIAACGGVDSLAVTCLDRLRGSPRGMCINYYAPYQAGDDDLFLRDLHGWPDNISDIKLGPPRDLAHQERLTRRLLAASPGVVFDDRPGYRPASEESRTEQFISLVEDQVKVPVRFTSFGPSAKDTQER